MIEKNSLLKFYQYGQAGHTSFYGGNKKLLLPNPPGAVLFLANVYKMSFDKTVVKNFVDF